MKKILLIFLSLTTIIMADSWEETNKKIVDEYIQVGYILTYGTYSDSKDFPDAEKYFLKALKIMEQEKLDLNSYRGSQVYNGLGRIYALMASEQVNPFSMKDSTKEQFEKAIEYDEKAIKYLELSSQILNKLDNGYGKYKKEISGIENTINNLKGDLALYKKTLDTK